MVLLACIALGCGKIIGIAPVTHQDAASQDSAPADTAVEDVAPPPPEEPSSECDPPSDAGVTSGPYADVVRSDAPLAYWRFEEPKGALSIPNEMDSTAFAAMVTNLGGTITLGEPSAFPGFGSAARVDGDSFFNAGKVFNFGKGSYTIEVWFRATKVGVEEYRWPIVHELAAPRRGYNVHFTSEAIRAERWFDDKAGGNAVGPPPKADGTGTFPWIFLVARYDAGKQISSLFVDGLQTSESETIPDVSNTGLFRIGEKLDGWVDEVAVWDSVLPCHRIKAHFAAAK